MGATQSVVSGHHHAHAEGRRDRRFLKHVSTNEVREPCSICSETIELAVGAYRCSLARCGYVLHDACYHLRKKMKKHFAHPDHRLTLSDVRKLPAAAGPRSCNICAVGIDVVAGGGGGRSSFVYACGECQGFYAHPRCCRLPRTMLNNALHEHELTLLPKQPRANGHDGRGRGHGRRCLNAAGNCRNARRLDSDAWSYQCNWCHVEVCLECQLPDHGGPAPPENGCGCGNVVETTLWWVATETGNVLRALCRAWLGAPMPAPTPASNSK